MEATIQSVMAQTFADWELLLIDDASSDTTPEIARRFCALDARIRYFPLEANSGAAVARNMGLDQAQGRFIAFLDSDDLWAPNKLEAQIAWMKDEGVGFSYSGYTRMSEGGELLGSVQPPAEVTYQSLLYSNVIGCLTVVLDRERLELGRMPLIRKRQDYAFWLQLLKNGGTAKCYPGDLAFYRVRTGSISSNPFDASIYTWRVYRDVEKLSITRSSFYLGSHLLKSLLKRISL
jgi:teichuronic acid biosynthesis glycosyltransferase TuaG